MSDLRHTVIALLFTTGSVALVAQDNVRPEFDVVSIKRNASATSGGGARTLPDGTSVLVNQPIRSIILGASPVQTREVVGLPDWATTERYDITLKPPPGRRRRYNRTPADDAGHVRDRMKLFAHVEQRERDVYSMVLAHADGRLGPELKKSSLDCEPRPAGSPPPPPTSGPPSEKEFANRCGMMMGRNMLVSGGMPMNNLAASLYGLVGGDVDNQTGPGGVLRVHAAVLAPAPATAPARRGPESCRCRHGRRFA